MAGFSAPFDYRRYLFVILRRWWLVVFVVLATGAATWSWLQRQPDVYASRGTLKVDEVERPPIGTSVRSDPLPSPTFINTVVQSLTGTNLLRAVVANCGLEDDPRFAPARGVPYQDIELVGMLRPKISVGIRRGTRLIDVMVTDSDPVIAQRIALTLLQEFIKMEQADIEANRSGQVSDLKQQEVIWKKRVDEGDRALLEYRKRDGADDMVRSRDQFSARYGELSKSVVEAEAMAKAVADDLAVLLKVKDDPAELLKLPSVAMLPSVQQARANVEQRKAEFEKIKERYLWKHPRYKDANSNVQLAERQVEVAARGAGAALERAQREATAKLQNLSQSLAETKTKLDEVELALLPYNNLEAQLKSDRAQYAEIVASLKKTMSPIVEDGRTLDKSPYTISELPMISVAPFGPDRKATLVKAVVLALAGAIALILLMDRFDSSLRSVDQGEAELELGCLAALPEVKGGAKDDRSGIVMVEKPGSSQAEAFRTLRSSLSLLGDEANRRVFLVTSAVPAEGKTYSSLNLAIAFARQGFKTLLVDADLRRPRLSTLLLPGTAARETRMPAGLSDLLSGEAEPSEVIRATEIEQLFVLTAGRRAPNPSELLAQPKIAEFIRSAGQQFDRVIVDSAPINAVADTLSLAPLVHAVCLVVRAGKTPRQAVLRAVQRLRQAGARMAGFVLNRVPQSLGASYYYYYYGDPYMKDSVYGEAGKKA